MSISLERPTQILEIFCISSSQEDEILTTVKDETPLSKANKEESTFKEPCISDEDYLFEREIEEDEEGISGDHHANKNCIEQWFQVSIRLDQFCFCFYFVYSHLQFEYIRFHFVKLNLNFYLVLLHRWLHWQLHYI